MRTSSSACQLHSAAGARTTDFPRVAHEHQSDYHWNLSRHGASIVIDLEFLGLLENHVKNPPRQSPHIASAMARVPAQRAKSCVNPWSSVIGKTYQGHSHGHDILQADGATWTTTSDSSSYGAWNLGGASSRNSTGKAQSNPERLDNPKYVRQRSVQISFKGPTNGGVGLH